MKKHIITRSICSLLLVLAPVYAGCGNASSEPTFAGEKSSGCDSKTALIGVFESHLEILCGCTEPANTKALAPSGSLTCTIANGKTVVFEFFSQALPHQIELVIAGSPTTSPVHDPANGNIFPSFGVLFSQNGTHTFRDLFSSLTGSIVVQ